MNEQSEQGDAAIPSGQQGEVVFLLKKLQEQLTFLERKVDLLVSQSKEKASFNKERAFSKPPFRSSLSFYGPSRHGGRLEHSGPSRERTYESSNRPAKPYGHSDSRGFAGKKKPFFQKHRD